MTSPAPIKTIQQGTNGQLIATANKLYPLKGHGIDMTYGDKGGFWSVLTPTVLAWSGGIFERTDLTMDILSSWEDYRSVLVEGRTYDWVTFDPPYMVPGGRKTSTTPGMNSRYGIHHTEKTPALQWERQILPGISEANRVLKKNGMLWLKLMDYVSSGKVHWYTKLALPALEERGFRLIDEFILDRGTGPQPKTNLNGTPRRQVHARNAHSVLMIARKVRDI